MSDDLIPRLRAILAEVEHRLGGEVTPRLAQALSSPRVGADVGAEPPQIDLPPYTSKAYGPSMADSPSDTRETKPRPKDYVPTHHDVLRDDTYPAEDFIGTGDTDPLGHDALIRSR